MRSSCTWCLRQLPSRPCLPCAPTPSATILVPPSRLRHFFCGAHSQHCSGVSQLKFVEDAPLLIRSGRVSRRWKEVCDAPPYPSRPLSLASSCSDTATAQAMHPEKESRQAGRHPRPHRMQIQTQVSSHEDVWRSITQRESQGRQPPMVMLRLHPLPLRPLLRPMESADSASIFSCSSFSIPRK